ncbi:MAG: hypothetical protein OEY21_08235 [Nitrospira sp.]|nr:hypothetical protein [Nitrospira sp.]
MVDASNLNRGHRLRSVHVLSHGDHCEIHSNAEGAEKTMIKQRRGFWLYLTG